MMVASRTLLLQFIPHPAVTGIDGTDHAGLPQSLHRPVHGRQPDRWLALFRQEEDLICGKMALRLVFDQNVEYDVPGFGPPPPARGRNRAAIAATCSFPPTHILNDNDYQ